MATVIDIDQRYKGIPLKSAKDENAEGNQKRMSIIKSEERNGAENSGKDEETEPAQKPKPTTPKPKKVAEEPKVKVDDTDSRIDVNIIWEPQIYADTVLEAYNIFQKTMHVFFRYPIFLRRDPEDGSYVLKYKQCSLFSFAFAVTSIVLLIMAVSVCFNTLGILLNIPSKSQQFYLAVWTRPDEHILVNVTKYELRSMELYLFQRNLVPVIIILCLLVHTCVGNLQLVRKRHVIAAYYTFWLKAVELMKIDAAYDLVVFMRYFIFMLLGFLICLGIMEASKLAPISAGAPSIFAFLTLRLQQEDVFLHENFWLYRILFGCCLLYVFLSAKMFIILFIFTSKLLKNCILVWNHRLDRVLNDGERYRRRSEKHPERIGFDHLFKDYVCILDLMEGADVIFANTVESFYATHVLSIIFELFYLYQSLTVSPEFKRERRVDVFVIGIFVAHSIIFMYQASMSGSDVAECSLDGLEIIRRKGILGRRSDEELYFVLSLHMSYTGHFDIGINASKMFTFNKSFLISMFILAFTFFIIVVQFTPVLQMTDVVKMDRIHSKVEDKDLASFVEGFYGKAGLRRASES